MLASHGRAIACAAAIATAAAAHATFIQIDVNNIQVDAAGAFDGETHTGDLTLTSQAASNIAAIQIDGAEQPLGSGMGSLTGRISLDAGAVVGGFVRLVADDGSIYETFFTDDAGAVASQAGSGFRVDGLSDDGVFDQMVDGDKFAGVLVGPLDGQTFSGSFLLHGFGPDAAGFDGRADLDLFLNVPAPGAAPLLAGAGILLTRRRR